MKAMIGYGWYQKPDMYRWAISGVEENFPPETATHFFFEAARIEDLKEFEDAAFAMGRTGRPGENWPVFLSGQTSQHILEHGCHRELIAIFMASDCDVLIVPQDDNRFQAPLLPDLQKLWDKYGTNLGWISGRDGHGFGYENMVCSPFSDSNATKEALPIGDYREVLMMNTGPVVYFRHVIDKVGLPDPDMPWYWWSDYSLKCHHAGLTNILLSMDAKHEKFGRIGNNPDLFKPELVADCLRRFNERWRPIYGRNPL